VVVRFYPLHLTKAKDLALWPDELDCRRVLLTRQREEFFVATGGFLEGH